MTKSSVSELEEKVVILRKEHELLDGKLGSMVNDPLADDLEIQAIKRQKLFLKDSITNLESQLNE